MRVVTLDCPKCGAPLSVKDTTTQLACGYCAAKLSVEREGGAISLEMAGNIRAIATGSARTSSELALLRLTGEHYRAEQFLYQVRGDISRLEQELASIAKQCPKTTYVDAKKEVASLNAQIAKTAKVGAVLALASLPVVATVLLYLVLSKWPSVLRSQSL